MQTLRQRARITALIRDFFEQRSVLEVTLPVLGRRTVTEPGIESIQVVSRALAGDDPLFLQTSPEYFMKRLLAAGSGPIYAMTPAFRDGESGRQHNPEFTLLEWYRPGFSLTQLMDEVQALVQVLHFGLDWSRLRYQEAFLEVLGLDPMSVSDSQLATRCAGFGAWGQAGLGRDEMLDLLFSHAVAPGLGGGGVFVHSYPASQAALACVSSGDEPVAMRFELLVNGLELANGYQELSDAREQRRRFEADRQRRAQKGQRDIPVDEALIAALEAGMPATSGVALGLERLLMVVLDLPDLRDALTFPFDGL